MQKQLLFLLLIFFACTGYCQVPKTQDIKEIKALLKYQEKAWSDHDLEGFMCGYWHNKELKFYGSGGLTLGWQKTLDNYKKRYPTKAHTGTLNFTIDDISIISKDAYHVMGQYHLKRKMGDAHGIFIIILKKINGKWKIIADMSC